MKTQLLEDIGENAASAPASSALAGKSTAPCLAPPGDAAPAKSRAAGGVWRQKPVEEALPAPARQPDETLPLELDKVFEEIAALEAQLVSPVQQTEPALAPADPRPEPAESASRPAAAADEFMPGLDPKPAAQDPVFDFTVPQPAPSLKPWHSASPALAASPGLPAADPDETTLVRTIPDAPEPRFDFTPPPSAQGAASPFTPAASGFGWPARRYVAWTAALLVVALLVQGGRWLFEERKDAGALAVVAAQATPAAAPSTPARAADAAAPPAVSASRPEPSPPPPPPPLVMLETASPPPGKAGQPGLSDETPEPPAARTPASAAKRAPPATQRKPEVRKARTPSRKAAEPVRKKPEREPARQLARASAIEPARPAPLDTSMAATLRACREHGYHAAQCVKRGCEITEYGFACRGR